MKLAAIWMPQANSAHSSAGMMLNASSANARAEPVNTGITAPVSVLGRAASIHAWNELVAIAFMSYF